MDDALNTLTARWVTLLSTPPSDPETFRSAVKTLAKDVIKHRSLRFETMASVQVDWPGDEASMVAETDRHNAAVKRCTTLLAEMADTLGMSSFAG